MSHHATGRIVTVTRREALKSSAAATAALLLAACGGAARPPATTGNAPAASPAPASTTGGGTGAGVPTTVMGAGAGTATGAAMMPAGAAGQPKRGGTLRVAQASAVVPFEFQQLGPHSTFILLNVFDTLVRYDDKLQPQPRLAESWQWNPDNTVLTVKLRRGVTYHTGREFTSADVRFNFERVKDPKVASQFRGNVMQIKEIAAPDPVTVVFTFEKPYLPIFDVLTRLVMLDAMTAADLEGAKQVVGTGPFKWGENVPGNKLTLVLNDKYWQICKPYLDRVEMQIIEDKQSMVLGVESGQREVAWQVGLQDLARLRNGTQVRAEITTTGSQFLYLGVNVAGDVVKDKRVRQALNAAIDRKRIVDTLVFGLAEPTALPWPKNSPAYSADLDRGVTFDLQKAKQLMQAAGVPAGTTFTVGANTQDPNNGKIAQVIQADLAKIDVKMEIQNIENSVFQQSLSDGKFGQLYANNMGNSNLIPVSFFLTAFPVRVTGNASKYMSPEYTDLVGKMQTETETAKLKPLYESVNKLLLDESFNMPYCQSPQGWVLQRSVKNFAYDNGNFVILEDAWLDK